MSIFTQKQIEEMYQSSRKEAVRKLTQLPVYCGHEPTFGQLSGWVYKQTIQYCIRQELNALKIKAEITEHDKLKGRAKVDLKVNMVAIEIKNSGLFGLEEADKYGIYRKIASAKGWWYLFVTRKEDQLPYRTQITRALGGENVFFLDTEGDWDRFVDRLAALMV